MPDEPLDRLDREIVRRLQVDGRRSFRDLARELDVAEGTVRARVRRLQESGVLRILAFADPAKLGGSVLALVLLRIEADAHDRIVAVLSSWREVTYVSTLLGRADVYVQVVSRDNETLWQLVSGRLRTLDGVIETETMIETKVHKFTYAYEPMLAEPSE